MTPNIASMPTERIAAEMEKLFVRNTRRSSSARSLRARRTWRTPKMSSDARPTASGIHSFGPWSMPTSDSA